MKVSNDQPEDVVVGVEESSDGVNWTELAWHDGNGWSWHPDSLVLLGATENGYQRLGIAGIGPSKPTALFRLTARLVTSTP